MRHEKMARAPSRDAADEIAAIEERIALAEWLLYEEKPDEAALALDGLLWRMAELVIGDGEDSQILMRLRLAARAPNVEARLAHYAALARDVREMIGAPRAQVCQARRSSARSRRQVRRDRYVGYRQSA